MGIRTANITVYKYWFLILKLFNHSGKEVNFPAAVGLKLLHKINDNCLIYEGEYSQLLTLMPSLTSCIHPFR